MSEGDDEATPRTDTARLRLLGVLLLGVAGVVAAILLLAGGGGAEGFPAGDAPPRQEERLGVAARQGGCEYRRLRPEGPGEDRRGRIDYRSEPPHSGNVHPDPVPVGAYAEQPVTEEVVHSLLHGRVVIWFDPDLPDDDRGALKDLYDEDDYHLLLVPRAELPFEVAATAWGRRLTCDRLTRPAFDAIRAFRQSFRDRSPEFVP